MKLYVACHSRELAEETAAVLERRGHVTTSRWHRKAFLPTEAHSVEERMAIAQEDYDDIVAAGALVLIAGPEKYSGGKFVEAGIAIGLDLPVIVIGRRENMLLWHENVMAFDTTEDAADAINSIGGAAA